MLISIAFGALSPPLAEQLHRTSREVALWQKDADAITRLLIRRLIPEAVGREARRKLLRNILNAHLGPTQARDALDPHAQRHARLTTRVRKVSS